LRGNNGGTDHAVGGNVCRGHDDVRVGVRAVNGERYAGRRDLRSRRHGQREETIVSGEGENCGASFANARRLELHLNAGGVRSVRLLQGADQCRRQFWLLQSLQHEPDVVLDLLHAAEDFISGRQAEGIESRLEAFRRGAERIN